MSGRFNPSIFALAVFMASCGGGESDQEPSEAGDYYRVDLRVSETGATFEGIERVTLSARPTPHAAGQYMVAAYSGSEVLEAHLVSAPTFAFQEGVDDDGNPFSAIVDIADSVESVFVAADDSIDRITLVGATGELETLNQSALPQAKASQSLLKDGLEAQFPHLKVVTDATAFPAAISAKIESLSEPSESDAERITNAFRLVPEASRRAVTFVAVADLPNGGAGTVDGKPVTTLAFAWGSWMVLNAATLGEDSLTSTVVHEAAHNFTFLSDFAAGGGECGLANENQVCFSPAQVGAAQRVLNRSILQSGLASFWAQLHATGVSVGVTQPHDRDAWVGLGNNAYSLGFASPYGSSSVWEDIAEYSAELTTKGATNPLCAIFEGAGDTIPNEAALPWAKLALLDRLGLMHQDAYSSCVGSVDRLLSRRGVHMDSIAFTGDLKAGYADLNGGHFLSVLASGPDSYRLLLRISDPQEQGEGVYRLDDIHFFNIDGINNAVLLAHDEPLKARTSGHGLVVVTEASSERVSGAIFFLTLENAAGLVTDAFKVTTFNID